MKRLLAIACAAMALGPLAGRAVAAQPASEDHAQRIRLAHRSFNEGVKLLDLGLYKQAISAFEQARNTYLILGEESYLGGALYNLGKAWYAEGQPARALQFYEQAERLLTGSGDQLELANLHVSVGIYHENQETRDSYAEALRRYDLAEKILRTIGRAEAEGLGVLAINRGKLHERWGNYELAEKEYLQAETALKAARPQAKMIVYNNLAKVALVKKNYGETLRHAEQALANLEEALAAGFALGIGRNLRFIEQHRASYLMAVEALIETGQPERAYIQLEASRNKVHQLMVRLKEARDRDPRLQALWQERSRLEQAISEVDRRAVHGSSDEDAVRSRRRQAMESELAKLDGSFMQSPAALQRMYHAATLDLARLQASLSDDQVLIDYLVWGLDTAGAQEQWHIRVFVVRKDKIRVAKLSTGTVETLRLAQEYVQLHTPQSLRLHAKKGEMAQYARAIRQGSDELYRRVLKDLEPELAGAKRIFIIPDGPLNLVPFEALRDGRGRLLVDQYAISYLNSPIEAYERPAPKGTGAVIFGDIDYGRDRDGAAAWANIEGSAGILADIRKSMRAQMPVDYVSGPKATETHFKAMSKHHKLVLIWTHGKFNDYSQMPARLRQLEESGGLKLSTPEDLQAWRDFQTRQHFNDPLSNAFLTFAAVNKGGDGQNDGYLTAREVMGLDLNSQLTILAACESGLGRSSPAEGIQGLRKAFALAGSQHLLISLWQVDAQWTGDLITLMLQASEKSGKARGLQQAKRALIRKLQTAGLEPHPFYWAGFILVGRGD